MIDSLPVADAAADVARLFWTTPFEEYTVVEGMLLLFLVIGFIAFIVWMFKGGF